MSESNPQLTAEAMQNLRTDTKGLSLLGGMIFGISLRKFDNALADVEAKSTDPLQLIAIKLVRCVAALQLDQVENDIAREFGDVGELHRRVQSLVVMAFNGPEVAATVPQQTDQDHEQTNQTKGET